MRLLGQNVEFRAFVGTASLDRIFGQMLFTTDESDTQHVPLCQSPSSRRAAFALLAVLVKCEPNDESAANNSVAEVRQSLLWKLEPQLTPSLRLSGWGYEPTSQHRAALVGLKNQSSTCYMNSLLQQLFMIPPFRSGILSAQIAETDEEALADNLLYQFQRMFAHLTLSERHAFDTLQFCLAYKDENGQPINVRLQQDVLEFFNVFCDRIERGLKGGAQEKLIHDVFGGKLANQRLCLGGCESMRQNDEDFYSVSLDVKNHRSMLSSLSEYVTGETISDFNCETCGRKTDIIKRGCLLNLHQTVIFHLKRFEFDFSTFQHEKLNVRFEFPLSIDLEPFTKEGLERKDHEQKQQKAREQGQQTAESLDPYRLHPAAYYQYDLVGVLVHTGTATGGHYYSFAKQRDSASTPDALSQWFELNDSTVRPFDLQNLDEECFGGDSESTETNAFGSPFTRKTERYKSAYMLIYERRSIKSVCQTQAASLIAPTLEKAIKEVCIDFHISASHSNFD
jgi:ubiquitin C-terminal hydrolase